MRITELQSVIAELRRKLNTANDNKIIEEDEEEEDEDVDDDDAQSGFTSDIENQGRFYCTSILSNGFFFIKVFFQIYLARTGLKGATEKFSFNSVFHTRS